MTDLEVRPDAEPARPPVQAVRPAGDSTVSRVQQTAMDLQAAHQIATAICGTALAPAAFRGKPDDGAAAIMLGDTLGLHPMIALQNIFVVHGAPSMYARTMAAIARAQGHQIWTEHEAEGTVTVCGQRKGETHIESVTFTIEDAERAGYVRQNAKYTTDPKSMLYARALAICSRRTAPDALLGIPYSIEELEDLTDVVETVPPPSSRSGASRLRSAVPAATAPAIDAAPAEAPAEPASAANPEPQDGSTPVDAGVVVEDPPDDDQRDPAEPTTVRPPAAEPINRSQMNKLQARFIELGCRARDKRIAVVSQMIGRQVDSAGDLTKDEAGMVLDTLDTLASPEDFAARFNGPTE